MTLFSLSLFAGPGAYDPSNMEIELAGQYIPVKVKGYKDYRFGNRAAQVVLRLDEGDGSVVYEVPDWLLQRKNDSKPVRRSRLSKTARERLVQYQYEEGSADPAWVKFDYMNTGFEKPPVESEPQPEQPPLEDTDYEDRRDRIEPWMGGVAQDDHSWRGESTPRSPHAPQITADPEAFLPNIQSAENAKELEDTYWQLRHQVEFVKKYGKFDAYRTQFQTTFRALENKLRDLAPTAEGPDNGLSVLYMWKGLFLESRELGYEPGEDARSILEENPSYEIYKSLLVGTAFDRSLEGAYYAAARGLLEDARLYWRGQRRDDIRHLEQMVHSSLPKSFADSNSTLRLFTDITAGENDNMDQIMSRAGYAVHERDGWYRLTKDTHKKATSLDIPWVLGTAGLAGAAAAAIGNHMGMPYHTHLLFAGVPGFMLSGLVADLARPALKKLRGIPSETEAAEKLKQATESFEKAKNVGSKLKFSPQCGTRLNELLKLRQAAREIFH